MDFVKKLELILEINEPSLNIKMELDLKLRFSSSLIVK